MLNREFLESKTNEWLDQASEDLSNRIERLMNGNNLTIEGLSEKVDVSVDEITAVLHGDIDSVSIASIIRLMFAVDVALSAMPITPFGRPNFTTMNTIDFCEDESDEETNDEEVSDVEEDDEQPIENRQQPMFRQPFGSRPDSSPRMTENPYNNLCVDDLKTIICRNLWDTELDIDNASRQDLIDFIMHKEECFAHRREAHDDGRSSNHVSGHNVRLGRMRPTTVQTNGGGLTMVRETTPLGHQAEATNQTNRISNDRDLIEAIIDAAERDPRLAERISRLV